MPPHIATPARLASWNEWLAQGVKYRDLLADAEVCFALRDACAPPDAPPLAEARLPLFTRRGLLREGWFAVALRPPAEDGGCHASSGLAREEGSEEARVEQLVRRYERGAVARVPWLDTLTFDALAQAHVERERRAAEDAQLLGLEAAGRGERPPSAMAQPGSLSLLVELPRFSQRVVWDEREDRVDATVATPAVTAHGAAAIGAVADPEISRESPAELKQLKLARGLTRLGCDADLKPDSAQRRLLTAVVRKPPTAPLTGDELQLLWRFRHSLKAQPEALAKFLRAVDWRDAAERRQANALLREWSPLAPAAALELLSSDFTAMPEAREHAVEALGRAGDEEILSYLLPLVAALRYEREDSSALSRFLVKRCAASFSLANFLHWYLVVEFEDAAYSGRFAATHTQFIAQLKAAQGEDAWDCICQQAQLLAQLGAVSKALKAQGGNTDRKKERLRAMLAPAGDFGGLGSFEGALPLPHDPRVLVTGVLPRECSVFKSALSPLKITFMRAGVTDAEVRNAAAGESHGAVGGLAGAARSAGVHRASEDAGAVAPGGADSGSRHAQDAVPVGEDAPSPAAAAMPVPVAHVIYKREDDLRQDQLVINMICLMDKLLKAENLDLRLKPYSVVATGRDEGLVEFVPSHNFSQVLSRYKTVSRFFRECAPDAAGPHGTSQAVMDTYVRSCAGYCVITYILGVGDRHLDNLMLTKEGHLFHIDFGYILGHDPKPFPPPMKLNREMVEGMGGINDEWFRAFKNYAVEAYNILRRSGNLVLNLFHLMAGANIPDISADSEKVLLQLQEKLRLDLDDEAAVHFFQRLIQESMSALFPQLFEVTHRVAQAMR